MLVKVALVQHTVGLPIDLDLKLHLFRKQPDFICFPEYWGADAAMADQADLAAASPQQLDELARLSAELSCTVIGGTVVIPSADGLSNVAPLFERGRLIGDYTKRFPTSRELERGITSGREAFRRDHGAIRIGVAICADCLHPGIFAEYARDPVDLLFVPNASPYRPGELPEEKFDRDERIFVAGAKHAGAYVIKVCGVGTMFGGRLQGRSLVASPWGVLNRVPPDQEHRSTVITVNLSLVELREFRALYGQRGTAAMPLGSGTVPGNSI